MDGHASRAPGSLPMTNPMIDRLSSGGIARSG
jgi:hypothetical protein